MKKVISIVLVLMILLSLSACGGKAADSSKAGYPGTWKIDHLVIEGAEYAQSELAALGDYRGRHYLSSRTEEKPMKRKTALTASLSIGTKQKMAFFWMAKKF